LFQEFRIWQMINNIQITEKPTVSKRFLLQEEKELLFEELNIKSKIYPVVEKILNQMVHVVNSIIETNSEKNEIGKITKFFKPDEIRIELARELKKSAKEREELTASMNKTTADHEAYRKTLETEFGLSYVSRHDIIRYKLYLELEHQGYKTLYSNSYIPREKLFSKEFDIEHIIPQSRMFDDSFSNKVLETRSANLEKDNATAYDYVSSKYGEQGLSDYLQRIEELLKAEKITRTKYNKLKMKGCDIPDDFINRDLRDTQYISKKAKEILETIVKEVVSTTGSITDRLRDDWQLTDILQELNWGKYDAMGMTEIFENREGHSVKRIKDWTKRNDHRHHAMDALTIAFTKRSFIQYLNNLNARSDKASSLYGIEAKELHRDDKGKLRFNPPLPITMFRAETKKQLDNVLISIKAKNKVVTLNTNTTKSKNGLNRKRQLTPRGQLHLETIYGSIIQYVAHEENIGGSFNASKIESVAKASYRTALLNRLTEFSNDPKKAFTGKNSPDNNPIFIDKQKNLTVPGRIKIVTTETIYTIRKEISPDLKIEKVIDPKIREVLKTRLDEFNGDSKKAFSNLEENPIWLNKRKNISVKSVTISGVSNAVALHEKKDKDGRLIPDKNGNPQPADFVNTGNNHHVAFYRDGNGNLQENVISFFEATTRASMGIPVIDKEFRREDGWEFLFTLKQNEYFVFPNEQAGFNPMDIDLLDPVNYHLISPNLFRVQKFSKLSYGNSTIREYVFRHHLETTINDNKALKDITFKSLKSLSGFEGIVKVRINHIGEIVSVGEY
jgi:CRISPR-associated endonuclease Csn1